mgnify:CR=1 FL=1
MGGVSAEHAISLRSAEAVTKGLERLGHQVLTVAISKAGRWLLGDMTGLLARAAHELVEVPPDAGRAVTMAAAGAGTGGSLLYLDGGNEKHGDFDLAFPVLHGPGGEDGSIQGLFESMGVPFVGAGSAASAIAMDKLVMKTMAAAADIEQVEFLCAGDDDAALLGGRIEAAFGFPCFVKPAALGSSVGISKVETAAGLGPALSEARRWGPRVVVERAVRAREVELSLLGTTQPQIAPAGEVVPDTRFYDFDTKYVNTGAGLLVPAELERPTIDRLENLALRVWNLIGCTGMLRVDFFIEEGRVLLNEANTIPGFTEISMYPRCWKAGGLGMSELLARLIDTAMERGAQPPA